MKNKLKQPIAVLYDWDGLLMRFRAKEFLVSINDTLQRFDTTPLQSLKESKSIRSTFSVKCGNRTEEAFTFFRNSFSKHIYSRDDLLPGSIEMLSMLKSYKLPQGLVSNLDYLILQNEVSYLSLNHYFTIVMGSYNDEHLKPKPDLIIEAIEKMNLPFTKPISFTDNLNKLNDRIWYIGDSQGDVIAANEAGCTSILVNEALSENIIKEVKADIICHNLYDIKSILFNILNPQKETYEINR